MVKNQLIVAALKQRKSVQSIWQLSVTIQQALIFSDGERNLTQQSGGRKLLRQEVVSVYVQKCREMRNIFEEECFSNVCCSVGQALSWWNMRTRLPWCLLTASQCRRPDLSVIGKVRKRNCELVFKFTFGENTLRFLLHPGQYLQNECESQRVPRLIKGWIEVPASKCLF